MTFSEGSALIPVRLRGAWGFIDTTGKLAIDPQYGSVAPFSEGCAAVSFVDWVEADPRSIVEARHGFIDEAGQWVIPPRERWFGSFSEGRARFTIGAAAEQNPKNQQYYLTGGLHGFIDSTGKDVVAAEYDKASDFRESRALVSSGGKYGFIDCDGQVVVPLELSHASDFHDGLARVTLRGSAERVTRTVGSDDSRSMLSRLFFGSYERKKTTLRQPWLHGYIDLEGREVIAPQFSYATDFSEGLAAVVTASRTRAEGAIIDLSGNIEAALPPGCEIHSPLSMGLLAATVQENGAPRAGWLNNRGEWHIPPRFDRTFPFNGDRAIFLENKRYGYVDLEGSVVIPAQFDWAGPFQRGYAAVIQRGKYGIIDDEGISIWSEP